MKCCCLLALGLTARALAGSVDVGGLPRWELADTEVSTNVPFAVPSVNVKHLYLSLELAGTPSNNVQVAFGHDENGDGTLDVEETGMALGWDCGKWVVRSGVADQEGLAADGSWSAEAVTTNRVKRLVFDLGIRKSKPKGISAQENGVPLSWNLPAKLPAGLYGNTVDTLKLTVRGVDVVRESLRARLRAEGFVISVK